MKYLGFVRPSLPGTDCSRVDVVDCRKGLSVPGPYVLLSNSRAEGLAGSFITFDKCVPRGTKGSLLISSDIKKLDLPLVVTDMKEVGKKGEGTLFCIRRGTILVGPFVYRAGKGLTVPAGRVAGKYEINNSDIYTVHEGETFIWEEKLPSRYIPFDAGKEILPAVKQEPAAGTEAVSEPGPVSAAVNKVSEPVPASEPVSESAPPAAEVQAVEIPAPSVFQGQIEKYEAAAEKLRQENRRLKEELEQLRNAPVIHLAGNDEFFPGEAKDMVLAAVDEYLKKCGPELRRREILSAVLEKNEYLHVLEKRREELRSLLKGYDGLTPGLRKKLEELGFICTETGRHYKLRYYGDSRYWVTMAKTPSDSQRGDKNLIAKLIKLM